MSIEASTTSLRPEVFKPTPPRPPRRSRLIPWLQILFLIVVLAAGVVLWFLFTAKSVMFERTVASSEITVSGGLIIKTPEIYLMRPGTYDLMATAPGYHDLETQIEVTSERDQKFEIQMAKLPGNVTFTSSPIGAEVIRDGEILGATPFTLLVEAGTAVFDFQAPRYIAGKITADIEGMDIDQTVNLDLAPNWAMVTIPTTPAGATVLIDDADSGFDTPGPVEVLAGEHVVSVKKPGFARWTDIIFVRAGESLELDPLILEPVGGSLTIRSEPSGASVSIGGQFQGTTPLTVDLEPSIQHKLEVLLSGHQQVSRNVTVQSGQEDVLDLDLVQVTGDLMVSTEPDEVEVWVDGEFLGLSNGEPFTLHAIEHEIELKKQGHAGYRNHLTIQTGFTQSLRVRLLTLEQARLEALRAVRTTVDGQEIVLLEPTSVRMGASRRQPGRRANEVYRTANLDRLFYLGTREVTNAQFKQYATGHDSGDYQGLPLNKDQQPVVNVSWVEAAFYCNSLSEREGLEPFYITEGASVTGINPNSLGYRLPTEAEWAWAARNVEGEEGLQVYPWGNEFPPEESRTGNYADRAAQHVVGRILFDYNDNHTVTAPVGTFPPNSKKLYDIGGNVAEWVHDFYSIPEPESTVSVLGPQDGEYHVIRGSSYLHGTIVDVRLSFRDYGSLGRNDVGFRIARYAE